MKVSNCPGCGSEEDSEKLGSLATECNSAIAGRKFLQPPYYVLHCRRCGLFYKSDVATTETLENYYALTDFRKWEIEKLYPPERIVVNILRRLPIGSRILDFGCSSGRLLQRLVPSYECFGVEINEGAAAVARTKGIRMLEDLRKVDSGTIDAVVLVDVFEHLGTPSDILKTLVKLLRPGGVLIISTGTADCSIFKEDIEKFWYLRTIEHLVLFSKKYADFIGCKLDAPLKSYSLTSHYDTPALDRVQQFLKRFAYKTFKTGRPLGWASLLAVTPIFNRARHWSQPPLTTYSADHAVAVFERKIS